MRYFVKDLDGIVEVYEELPSSDYSVYSTFKNEGIECIVYRPNAVNLDIKPNLYEKVYNFFKNKSVVMDHSTKETKPLRVFVVNR